MYFFPLAITVWPALLPPWPRATTSADSVRKSIILPLPSSPHWEPIIMVFMIKMELGDLNEIPSLWQDNLTKLLSFPDKMSLKKGNVPGSGAGRMSVAVPDYPGSGQGMRQGRQCRRRKPKEHAIVKGNGGNADSRWFCASGVLGAGRFPPLAGKSFSGAQRRLFFQIPVAPLRRRLR